MQYHVGYFNDIQYIYVHIYTIHNKVGFNQIQNIVLIFNMLFVQIYLINICLMFDKHIYVFS